MGQIVRDSGSPSRSFSGDVGLLDSPTSEVVDSSRLVGESPAVQRALHQVEQVAKTASTVLILGETGTGKELIARAIHRRSSRATEPFVTLDCSAVPENLLESELFGHEKGAFTGAINRRVGRFERAHSGTLFIDEIGELPLEHQPKLLRVIQEREFEPVGGRATIRVDVRLVAATNRDLAALCETRDFRTDLYYRLNVFPIQLPPLRERPEDIPALVRHFVRRLSAPMGKELASVSSETMLVLARYEWPGNIRELLNVVERAIILSGPQTLDATLRHVMTSLRARPPQRMQVAARSENLNEINRAHILAVLRETNGIVAGPAGAAARLGVKRTTLCARMKKLGVDWGRDFRDPRRKATTEG
jgi:transcriptional regulator with GAF, ATPase, and Fis domain